MHTFDLSGCVVKTVEVPASAGSSEAVPMPGARTCAVQTRFSVNGGEDITKTCRATVYDNGTIDYPQLLDDIAADFIISDIRLLPATLHNGICGTYKYSMETLTIELKKITVL